MSTAQLVTETMASESQRKDVAEEEDVTVNSMDTNSSSSPHSHNDVEALSMEPFLIEPQPHGQEEEDDDPIPTSCCDKIFWYCCKCNPLFFKRAWIFGLYTGSIFSSYKSYKYTQELLMTTPFTPTENVPSGKFPSATFGVFMNRLVALLIAMVAVKLKHGAVFVANNNTNNNHRTRRVVPLYWYLPAAVAGLVASLADYASLLSHVNFATQAIFKSSLIVPVLLLGTWINRISYPPSKYVEGILISIGVSIYAAQRFTSTFDIDTQLVGFVFLFLCLVCNSLVSVWQQHIYQRFGRPLVDCYQMMLGITIWSWSWTAAGLIGTGDIPLVWEFVRAQTSWRLPLYILMTAKESALGQFFTFAFIREFGPVAFAIVVVTRDMLTRGVATELSSAETFHVKFWLALFLVVSVLCVQVRQEFKACLNKSVVILPPQDHPPVIWVILLPIVLGVPLELFSFLIVHI